MNTERIALNATALMLLLVLLASPPAPGAPDFARQSLGGHPLCEASAAVIVPCGEEHCLVVGDNEARAHLFTYRLTTAASAAGPGPDVGSRQALSFTHLLGALAPEEREISDIEGLTRLNGSEVLVVASHSRNKNCKARKKRRRLLGVTLAGNDLGAQDEWGFEQTRKPTCKKLFGAKKAKLAGSLRAACEAIEAAEKAADRAFDEDSAPACEAAQSLNVEGVVAIPEPGAGSAAGHRVWFGLRTPVIGEHAIVLRRTGPGADVPYDAARLVALGGRGIRDLTIEAGFVWLVAGPTADDANALFALLRFPVAALDGDGPIVPEPIGALPNGAEGLAIDGATAIVVMDGDEADEGSSTCRKDATYTTVHVPVARIGASRPH